MASTFTASYNIEKPEVGAAQDTWGGLLNANFDLIDDLLNGTIAISPQLIEGSWSIGATAVTATAAELNTLDGITATVGELNLLDGVTATTAELNYVDGVTSPIQTQLDAKQPLDAELTALAGLTSAADKVPYFTGSATAGVLDLQSTITNVDTAVPTSGAVIDRITLQTGVSEVFKASNVAYTNGGLITQAHGLASAPTRVSVAAVCTSADAGFSVGDVANVTGLWFINSGTYNTTPIADATNVEVQVGTLGLRVMGSGGVVTAAFDPAKWRLTIIAEVI